MPKLHVVVGGDPGALLELAAEGFLRPPAAKADDPFPSPPYLLALRQGGLRDDLFDRAVARGVRGWFDPPICVFHELPAWLGATQRQPLGDFERAALLEHLMREHGGDVFRGRESAFLGAVEQLIGELCAEDVPPETFAAAVETLGEREEFERRRDAALARAYAAYVAELDRLSRRDGRDTLADTARAIRDRPEALAEQLRGRREIRILGLADLRGGWRTLLGALNAAPAIDRVTLYVTENPHLPPDLAASSEAIPERDGHAARLFTDVAEPAGTIEVIGAVDADAELDTVAARIRVLVDGGAAPHRIAVVSREARPYADLAVRALERAGVPATARRRTGYREIPVVRALLALLRAGAEGWTRHGLVELGSQPYLASNVDVRVVDYIGFRERVTGLAGWLAALGRLLDEARAAEAVPEGDDERRAKTLPSDWVERARERFARIADQAQALEASRPLASWLEWLEGWLTADPWGVEQRIGRVSDDRWDVVRLDQLGWRSLRAIVGDWRAAERQWPSGEAALPVREFLEQLEGVLDGDVALWTECARGVQVVEALAASHRSFDHVFLVGMEAGRFPRRVPSSLLLGEHDREALRAAGLPLDVTADWDGRERALFRTLVAGATGSLTVSYVRLDDLGGEAIPSGFVDALLDSSRTEARPGRPLPVIRSAELAQHAHRAAQIERERATGHLSPWNGRIESPELVTWLGEAFGNERLWSPTQIEAYARCPWAYFSQRLLRLEALEDPDEDMDKRARGAVLHAALKRFYDRARERTGAPVFLQETDSAWARSLLAESLREALAGAGRDLWLGHPALREVKFAELERMLQHYLEFEIEENRKAFDGRTTAGRTVRTAVDVHELPFNGVVLERDGVVFHFRGTIDRVEVGSDDRTDGAYVAAVDYKTTKYAAPGAGKKEAWDDGVVIQVPLYAHALAVLRPGTEVSRVEYRAIKTAERVHNLSLVRVKKGGVQPDEEARAKMERALNAVAEHVRRIRAGEFRARPAASCHCPPFCHAWDICRVKGGPDDGRSW
jgi:superfamily I DNA/RNA helicase